MYNDLTNNNYGDKAMNQYKQYSVIENGKLKNVFNTREEAVNYIAARQMDDAEIRTSTYNSIN